MPESSPNGKGWIAHMAIPTAFKVLIVAYLGVDLYAVATKDRGQKIVRIARFFCWIVFFALSIFYR